VGEHIVYNSFDISIGQMFAACSSKGLCRLNLSAVDIRRFNNWADRTFDTPVMENGSSPYIQEAVEQVNEYLNGKRRSFSIRLDLRGTVFQRRVWQALLQIPYGRTVTYRDVAAAVDNPRAVRAVGQANNKNPVAIIVPCHRVIGSDGSLVGYGGGLELKKRLLKLEGVVK